MKNFKKPIDRELYELQKYLTKIDGKVNRNKKLLIVLIILTTLSIIF